MIRIMVADDHPIVRKGIIEILREVPDVSDIIEAGDGFEIKEGINRKKIDVVLLDLNMPQMNGIDTIQMIKSKYPHCKILIVSMLAAEQYTLPYLTAGADGYINKNAADQELAEALKDVLKGRKYIMPEMSDKALNVMREKARKLPHEILSNREFQIMCMLAQGMNGAQIGRELSISSKTVSSHKKRILEKMRLSNSIELTRYAIDNELI